MAFSVLVFGLRTQINQARRMTAHSFRTAFATCVLTKTGDLVATEDLTAHANPGTARRHAKLSYERLRLRE